MEYWRDIIMNSKERIIKCINHEPIDRVPISTYDLVGFNENSFENKEPSYDKLMNYIRKYTDCVYMLEPEIIYHENEHEIIENWREDNYQYTKKTLTTEGSPLTELVKETDGVYTKWTIEHLLDSIDDIDKFLKMPFVPPTIDYTKYDIEKNKLGDNGIMMISIPDPIAEVAELFGMDKFLIYSITETDKVRYLMDAIHERQMYVLDKILDHDMSETMIRIYGPEYATPPYLSKEYFDLFVMTYLKPICEKIKSVGAYPRIHSHGKVGTLLDSFSVTKANIIEPLEPVPDGDISLAEVKRKYGKRFCLMGNIELKELEFSSRKRINSLVKETMNSAKHGSGFILMPTAGPIDIPLKKKTEENFIQMIESALEYGIY